MRTPRQAGEGFPFAKQDALLPLLPTDMAPGCGCNFTRYQSKGEAPIFRWLSEGKKQAMVRTAAKIPAVKRPGTRRGAKTRRKICVERAPSILAASTTFRWTTQSGS